MICLWDKIVKKKKKLEFINIIIERKKKCLKEKCYIYKCKYLLFIENESIKKILRILYILSFVIIFVLFFLK